MTRCVIIIFSLVLLLLETTTANQLVAVRGGDDNGSVKKCFDKERHALLHFKAGLQDPYDTHSTWSVDQHDCCEWDWVVCNNRTGHVEGLIIGNGGLVGVIPSSIGFLTKLEIFDLSENSLCGSIPPEFGNLTKLIILNLIELHLSYNMLDGIPRYLGNLCSLERLYFTNNSAVVNFPSFLNNLSGCTSHTLRELYASHTRFTGSVSDETQTLKNLTHLVMSSCKLGPRFPRWIHILKKLTHLDISDNKISDTIPLDFWGMWPSQLMYLNLSSNNISGKVPDISSNFGNNSVIDLSSNSLYGTIPDVPSTLMLLNLSRNKLGGGIPLLCQIVDGLLQFLDLSHNSLTGQLPDCLQQFKQLKLLNLGHNNLCGRLPSSIGSLINLEALYVYKNNFSGELPLALKSCTSLNSLNLGANKFSGNVPIWIGENLKGLYALILGSNNFFGTIPLQLCQLGNLQILDLSRNNLHGTIPSCLNNLTSMVPQGFLLPQNMHSFPIFLYPLGGGGIVNLHETQYQYVDHAIIEWQGNEREFFRNLRLLKMIDLSSNNLTGQFPYQLTNLYELVALNLSTNALVGEIPVNISRMKNLISLDLSRNNFSGGIPSSMSQMTLLNDLDVSFNNLSGRIPSSTQLQSFATSRYDGNTQLCGPPLTKKCPGDELEVPPAIGEREGDGEGVDELRGWFYMGGGIGFATGFWIACGALLLNRRGRHVFFQFHDKFRDWVYVKIVVFFANFQRFVHA
ncbi:receptor-like protein EIX2 [Lactuca sativa]|uniref:receptor-like protein EIX2 n=1 Tax=Lactuca sativa TaxID=4236 RepID=UPI000CD90D36|nr:receptor-like protein EIX2 [Lactuca sativa]